MKSLWVPGCTLFLGCRYVLEFSDGCHRRCHFSNQSSLFSGYRYTLHLLAVAAVLLQTGPSAYLGAFFFCSTKHLLFFFWTHSRKQCTMILANKTSRPWSLGRAQRSKLWKSRWLAWAPLPNSLYSLRGRPATLNSNWAEQPHTHTHTHSGLPPSAQLRTQAVMKRTFPCSRASVRSAIRCCSWGMEHNHVRESDMEWRPASQDKQSPTFNG